MSGFPVPGKAIEAGTLALDNGEFCLDDDTAVWDDVAREVLEAALPVLAEDGETKDRLACAFRDWIHGTALSRCGMGEDECPDWPLADELMRVALAALFGVASPSTKETT